ncbi:hypothetical protein [Glycomyces tarimensis]
MAKKLNALAVPGIDVKSLHDTEIQRLLADTGHTMPAKPAIVEIDGGHVTVRTGLAMRLRLARRIGWRNAGALIGLAAAEGKARTERAQEQRSVSRRWLIGGAAASAGAVLFGTATPANAGPGETGTLRKLTPAEAGRLQASETSRQALRVWGGSPDEAAYAVTGSIGETMALLKHDDPTTFTCVDMADPSVAVTLRIDAEHEVLRYYTVGGTPLAEVAVQDGRSEVRELSPSFAPASAEELTPMFSVSCFIDCVGGGADYDCAMACGSCVLGSAIDRAINCPICLVCAGGLGVRCVNQCR